MNENEIYFVVNGEKRELTQEQLKSLGVTLRKNPFERVKPNERYHYVTSDGVIDEYIDANDETDTQLYKISNYFNDEAFAKQVALYQLLYRKLLKFAYDNEFEDTTEWDGVNQHCSIHCDMHKKTFDVSPLSNTKYLEVYFLSEEAAKRAIHEVVEPFMKEHPDFVW